MSYACIAAPSLIDSLFVVLVVYRCVHVEDLYLEVHRILHIEHSLAFTRQSFLLG